MLRELSPFLPAHAARTHKFAVQATTITGVVNANTSRLRDTRCACGSGKGVSTSLRACAKACVASDMSW